MTTAVRATGSPFEVGRAHGVARADALRAFLDDGLGRLDHLRRPAVPLDELRPVIRAHGEVIAAATPALHEELRGLADGAGISEDEALLLQLRREVLGYRSTRRAADCTTYARLGPEPVLAQTVDLNGDLDDQIAVLDVGLTGSGRRALVLSFAGLLGYLGVNSDGLAVGINLVLGGRWRPGVPPYLAIRHLLDTAPDVPAAIAALRDLPLASSRTIVLCDRERTAFVEVLDDRQLVVHGVPDGAGRVELTHTNHYLHADLAPHDELNVFARNSSVRRLAECRTRLDALPADAGVDEHFALLGEPPILVRATGDIATERTVATVVLLPGRGELHLRPGGDGAPVAAFALGVGVGGGGPGCP
jgi:isopenicillin-N N-acyltransferase-like protein